MSDKNKVTLRGISSKSGGSGSQLMSFRFSPDSEEIEEVMVTETVKEQVQSEAASGKAGETSPIKEYLMKHKWAHKWDKRSLSLDLDIKGKIKTVIEDKRKIIASHFIPEENQGSSHNSVPQSHSIPEHISTVASTLYTSMTDSLIRTPSSDSYLGSTDEGCSESSSTTNSSNSTNSISYSTYSQVTNNSDSVSNFLPINLNHKISCGSSPSSPKGEASPCGLYEEVGQDVLCAFEATTYPDPELEERVRFIIPKQELERSGSEESLSGAGEMSRKLSNEHVAEDDQSSPKELKYHVEPDVETLNSFLETSSVSDSLNIDSSIRSIGTDSYIDTQRPAYSSSQVLTGTDSDDFQTEDLSFVGLIKTLVGKIIENTYSKYWIGALGLSLLMPWLICSMLLFFLGFSGAFITFFSWMDIYEVRKSEREGKQLKFKPSSQLSEAGVGQGSPLKAYDDELHVVFHPSDSCSSRLNSKSSYKNFDVGWMTTYEGEYDPMTYNLRNNKVVLVALDDMTLCISYPHPKLRIPKRRLWKDPTIKSDLVFLRHTMYHVSGAKVFIAPEGLAKNRVWNKKYPIGILLPRNSIVSKVFPGEPLDDALSEDGQAGPSSSEVNYSVQAGVTVSSKNTSSTKYPKKKVEREDCGSKLIYLFARTDREKDTWFRKLVAASKKVARTSYDAATHELDHRSYIQYMMNAVNFADADSWYTSRSVPRSERERGRKSKKSKKSKKEKDKTPDAKEKNTFLYDAEEIITVTKPPDFLNAFIARLFYDFLKSSHWGSEIQKLIEKKFHFLRKPSFLEAILVKELNLGTSMPRIESADTPILDSDGLWVMMDITYDGGMYLNLETYVNLLKLRKTPTLAEKSSYVSGKASTSTRKQMGRSEPLAPIFDSDADDSGESSEEELNPEDFNIAANNVEEPKSLPTHMESGMRSQSKFMRIAEKLAGSKVMQTDMMRKMVDSLGSTPIVLSVELVAFKGVICLNIPPPPTDRLWVSFLPTPYIKLEAKPRFGDRSVNISPVSEWIKRKILLEFERAYVIPNMDDFPIPLLDFKIPD